MEENSSLISCLGGKKVKHGSKHASRSNFQFQDIQRTGACIIKCHVYVIQNTETTRDDLILQQINWKREENKVKKDL